jgi:hypothetical protein
LALVHPPRHPRPALARDPHDAALDAGVKVAAVVVVGEEGVQLSAGSPPRAYRKAPACARGGDDMNLVVVKVFNWPGLLDRPC